MELITKGTSNRFYNQLVEINKVSEDVKPKQIIKIGSLLKDIFRTATKNKKDIFRTATKNKNDSHSKSIFFERIQLVFRTHTISQDIIDKTHYIRELTNDIRHNRLDPDIKYYELAIQYVAEVISFFSDTSISTEVEAIYNSSITLPEKPKVEEKKSEPELTINELDLINNPTPRLAVCLVLDTSSSMRDNDKIGELNKGVKMFFNSILNDELAKYSVEICVVSFGREVIKLLDFESIKQQADKFDTFNLVADGLTPMGQGVELGLKLLGERKMKYKDAGVEYHQPWLVLMTNGQPTDDISNATALTNDLITSKKLNFFSIAITFKKTSKKLGLFFIARGDGANIRTLSKFSTSGEPFKLKGLNFVGFFEWISQSIKKTSQSTPGDKVKLPPVSGWAE